MTTEETKFQPKDYKSDQYVRWCPGCGDHAVLNCLHKAMAEVGVAPQYGSYLRYRLFFPLTLLYEYVWLPYDPWSWSGYRYRREDGLAGLERMVDYR